MDVSKTQHLKKENQIIIAVLFTVPILVISKNKTIPFPGILYCGC